jgi:hypothetical protein
VKGTEQFVRAWGRTPEAPCESLRRSVGTGQRWRCVFWAACRREPIACGAFVRFVREGRGRRSATDIPTAGNYTRAMRIEA